MQAYAYDIIIFGDTENYVVKAAKKLIESSHRMNLTINENKIKYLVKTRREVNKTALKVYLSPLNK